MRSVVCTPSHRQRSRTFLVGRRASEASAGQRRARHRPALYAAAVPVSHRKRVAAYRPRGLTRRTEEILLSFSPWSCTRRYTPGPNSFIIVPFKWSSSKNSQRPARMTIEEILLSHLPRSAVSPKIWITCCRRFAARGLSVDTGGEFAPPFFHPRRPLSPRRSQPSFYGLLQSV
jgi:hypothetical protein